MEKSTLIITSIVSLLFILFIIWPEQSFKRLAKRHYANRIIRGSINRDSVSRKMFAGNIEMWLNLMKISIEEHRGYVTRECMAEIILAVTDMAEYYEIDILKEIENKVKSDEAED